MPVFLTSKMCSLSNRKKKKLQVRYVYFTERHEIFDVYGTLNAFSGERDQKNFNVYNFISIFHLTEIFKTIIIRYQYLRKNNPST